MWRTGLLLLLVTLVAWPARDVAAAAKRRPEAALFAAQQRRAAQGSAHHEYRSRLGALFVPGAPQAQMAYEWPAGQERGMSAGAAGDGKIFDPDRILDRSGRAHEGFHLLDQQSFTDEDRARLQKVTGMPGPWFNGEPGQGSYSTSAGERMADYFAAVVRRRDPERGWTGGYDGDVPTRKQLMRFAVELERIGRTHGLGRYRDPLNG